MTDNEGSGSGRPDGTARTRRPARPRAGRAGQPNMTDIARAAGVSMATTSRALNNLPGVAPATRERVLRVAEELSYVVSPEAAALSSGSTGRVAVVVPHLSRWFFGEMLNGIESVLRRADLDLMLYHVGEPDDRESFFRRLPARRKVDAVLVVGIPVSRPEQERLALMGVQVVAAGGQFAPYPYVSIDDATAGAQAVSHLVRLFARVPWGPEPGARAMAELLSLPEPPTAVFAHSDEIAFGALRTVRQAGLRVPDDLSVIGVDDHPLSAQLDLTTIGQDVLRQGQLAAQLVVDALEGKECASTLLPTRLVPRGSTGAPADR
jgi:LacI family repressor for deo operon, udp, cdd, tsx, nupC, and nupG